MNIILLWIAQVVLFAISRVSGLAWRIRERGVNFMTAKKRRKDDELGSNSAGQSGDIQQMPNAPEADSESVEELAEEGNAFEADAVQGVEDANDPDVSEVTTRQVPEDDVPVEYLNDEDEHVA
jgi:N utilization substance protein A